MDTSPTFDLAVPVRYILTHRAAAEDRVDLVLDLFRGAVQIHTRTIASVDREQAVLVMAKCRRYLQLRGVDAAPSTPAAQAPSPVAALPARPAVAKAANPPVTPMRPAPDVRPMAIAAKPSPARPSPAKPSSVAPAPARPAPARPAPAKPVSAQPLPGKPPLAKPGLLASRTAAARSGAPRQDRDQDRTKEARMPAPAAAAFDWMFEAV